jgi:hypothetical protein
MKFNFLILLIISTVVLNPNTALCNEDVHKEINHLLEEKHEISELDWRLLKFYVYTWYGFQSDRARFTEIRYDSLSSKFETNIYITETAEGLAKQGVNIIDELKKYGFSLRGLLSRELGFEPLSFNDYLYVEFYVEKEDDYFEYIEYAKFEHGNLVIF